MFCLKKNIKNKKLFENYFLLGMFTRLYNTLLEIMWIKPCAICYKRSSFVVGTDTILCNMILWLFPPCDKIIFFSNVRVLCDFFVYRFC